MRFLCSINFCFGRVEMRQFKNKCSGLKMDWRSPPRLQLFTECVLRHYILLFYTRFVDLAYKQLTMASSQAPNLLRRNNLSGDLTDDYVNYFLSLTKSPNRVMCTSL